MSPLVQSPSRSHVFPDWLTQRRGHNPFFSAICSQRIVLAGAAHTRLNAHTIFPSTHKICALEPSINFNKSRSNFKTNSLILCSVFEHKFQQVIVVHQNSFLFIWAGKCNFSLDGLKYVADLGRALFSVHAPHDMVRPYLSIYKVTSHTHWGEMKGVPNTNNAKCLRWSLAGRIQQCNNKSLALESWPAQISESAPRDDDDDGRWANFCATKNRLQPSLHIAGHFFHLLAQFGRKLLLHLQHPIECPQVQMECFCADRAVLILLLHSKNAIVAVSLYIRLGGD